jgi:cysteine synthase A
VVRRAGGRLGASVVNGSKRDVLHCIGDTALVTLQRIVPPSGCRIRLKMESQNPTGSMKDRMALAMVEAAEADGRLAEHGSVVEYTTGNTGTALSLVCAVKGYPLHIVTSDAYAPEKREHMRRLGATFQIVPSENGLMTEKLTRDMIETARVLAREPGRFWTDQMNNQDQIGAYQIMADEIWSQTDGRLDVFVQVVGTAASIRGTGEALRRRSERIMIVAVEPAESPVLSGGEGGAHRIDGVGAGFVVPLWYQGIADHIERVSSEEAFTMAARLAHEEGLLAGPSTGANVAAALRWAERLGPDKTVVTVMCDTGLKYMSKAHG